MTPRPGSPGHRAGAVEKKQRRGREAGEHPRSCFLVTGAAAGLDQDLTCSAVLPGVALLLSHRDHEPPCEASEVPDQELVRLTATDRPGQAGSHTADEYSNASDLERPSRASSNARPAPTTFTDRFGASSHRGDQGFKPAQLYSLSGDPSGHGRQGPAAIEIRAGPSTRGMPPSAPGYVRAAGPQPRASATREPRFLVRRQAVPRAGRAAVVSARCAIPRPVGALGRLRRAHLEARNCLLVAP